MLYTITKTKTALKCTNWKHERKGNLFRLPQETKENESVKTEMRNTKERMKQVRKKPAYKNK